METGSRYWKIRGEMVEIIEAGKSTSVASFLVKNVFSLSSSELKQLEALIPKSERAKEMVSSSRRRGRKPMGNGHQ